MNLIANDTTLGTLFTLSGSGSGCSNSQVCITIISLHEFQESMSNVIVSILILVTVAVAVAAKFARFVHIPGLELKSRLFIRFQALLHSKMSFQFKNFFLLYFWICVPLRTTTMIHESCYLSTQLFPTSTNLIELAEVVDSELKEERVVWAGKGYQVDELINCGFVLLLRDMKKSRAEIWNKSRHLKEKLTKQHNQPVEQQVLMT